MRVVLFISDDIQFVPALLLPLLKHHPDWVVRAYVCNYFSSDWNFLRKRIGFFLRNFYPFCISFGDLFRFVIQHFKRGHPAMGSARTLHEFIQSFGIETRSISDINSESILSELNNLQPDIFLFIPFGKIAGTKFLAIPKFGTFNVHLGILPNYRGALSAFWVLCHGLKEHGASIHKVVKKIDGGDLVAECRLPITTNSMRLLMLNTVEKIAPLVVDVLRKAEKGRLEVIEVSDREENYFFLPTKADFKRFYSNGCKLI